MVFGAYHEGMAAWDGFTISGNHDSPFGITLLLLRMYEYEADALRIESANFGSGQSGPVSVSAFSDLNHFI